MGRMRRLAVALMSIYCFVAVAYADLQRKLHLREDECVGDHEVLYTIARIDRLRSTRQLPEDGSLDEFAMCMLTNYQILKADGTINTDLTTQTLFSQDLLHRDSLSRDCIAKTTMRKIFECYLRSDIYIIDFAPRTRTMKPRSLF